MSEKLYRFIFDKQTGLYKGLTYEQPWADNTTVLQPHFEAGFKTVFDFEFAAWKLVPQEVFFKQMATIDQIETAVELKNNYIATRLLTYHAHVDQRFDVIDSKAEYDRLKILTQISINKSEIIQNRLKMLDLKEEILNNRKFILNLEDLLIQVIDQQREQMIYSRKFYWTSRLIDIGTNFYVRCRNVFFKFFNS